MVDRDTLPVRQPALPVLSAAVAAAVRHSTLRRVASRVGVSATTLSKLLDGRERVYGRTLEKLLAWFHREGRAMTQPVPDLACFLLGQLVCTLPEPSRADATNAVLDLIVSLHHDSDVEVPGWIAAVRTS